MGENEYSIRWKNLARALYIDVVLDGARSASRESIRQFLKVFSWLSKGAISDADFTGLYQMWIKSGKKEGVPLKVSLQEFTYIVEQFTEQDLDVMMNVLIQQNNQEIGKEDEWIDAAETLFLTLDDQSYGVWDIDRVSLFIYSLLQPDDRKSLNVQGLFQRTQEFMRDVQSFEGLVSLKRFKEFFVKNKLSTETISKTLKCLEQELSHKSDFNYSFWNDAVESVSFPDELSSMKKTLLRYLVNDTHAIRYQYLDSIFSQDVAHAITKDYILLTECDPELKPILVQTIFKIFQNYKTIIFKFIAYDDKRKNRRDGTPQRKGRMTSKVEHAKQQIDQTDEFLSTVDISSLSENIYPEKKTQVKEPSAFPESEPDILSPLECKDSRVDLPFDVDSLIRNAEWKDIKSENVEDFVYLPVRTGPSIPWNNKKKKKKEVPSSQLGKPSRTPSILNDLPFRSEDGMSVKSSARVDIPGEEDVPTWVPGMAKSIITELLNQTNKQHFLSKDIESQTDSFLDDAKNDKKSSDQKNRQSVGKENQANQKNSATQVTKKEVAMKKEQGAPSPDTSRFQHLLHRQSVITKHKSSTSPQSLLMDHLSNYSQNDESELHDVAPESLKQMLRYARSRKAENPPSISFQSNSNPVEQLSKASKGGELIEKRNYHPQQDLSHSPKISQSPAKPTRLPHGPRKGKKYGFEASYPGQSSSDLQKVNLPRLPKNYKMMLKEKRTSDSRPQTGFTNDRRWRV